MKIVLARGIRLRRALSQTNCTFITSSLKFHVPFHRDAAQLVVTLQGDSVQRVGGNPEDFTTMFELDQEFFGTKVVIVLA
jgi:hypothetical protein